MWKWWINTARGKQPVDINQKMRINLIINTPSQEEPVDMRAIRSAAILHNVPCITTLQGAWAAVNGIESSSSKDFTVQSLQEYYKIFRPSAFGFQLKALDR